MPDTMCSSFSCPSRSTCTRSHESGTQPATRQTWVNFDRDRQDELKCRYYAPKENTDG